MEGPAPLLAAIERKLPGRCCQRVGSALLLEFGTSVGRYEVPGWGVLEVKSGKWGTDDYERMFADIMDAVAGLPFTWTPGGTESVEHGAARARVALYHRFAYLRHVFSSHAARGDRLLSAYDLVLREPLRNGERTHRSVAITALRDVDGTTLHSVLTARAHCSAGARGGALAQALGGRLPREVLEPVTTPSVDVPENRFAKALLAEVREVLEGIRECGTGGATGFDARVQRECDQMRRELAPVLAHPLWKEVGIMRWLPLASTRLQRRRGYRELLRHYIRLRLAPRLPLSESATKSQLELKNIAQLYELWCFFRVAGALRSAKGGPLKARVEELNDRAVEVARGAALTWADGIELSYNLEFSRAQRDRRRRSTSLRLRPDITLWLPSGPRAGFHVFDAKFRVDAENREFLAEDLHKMHAYRDALPEVRSAWAIYPGRVSQFFSAAGEQCEFPSAGEAVRAALDGNAGDGVGAIGWMPSVSEEAGPEPAATVLPLRRAGP